MFTQRGLVPPAILTSTIVLVLCAIAWGALGALSIAEPAMPSTLHRYLVSLLGTLTLCAVAVNMAARTIRAIRDAAPTTTVCGYAEGYTDGLDAAPVSPAVSRLVPTRR
jgi:hypothetical protein